MERRILAKNAELYVQLCEDLSLMYEEILDPEILKALYDHLAELMDDHEVVFKQARSMDGYLAGMVYLLLEENDQFKKQGITKTEFYEYFDTTTATVKRYAKEHRALIQDIGTWQHPEWEDRMIDWTAETDIGMPPEEVLRMLGLDDEVVEDPRDHIFNLFNDRVHSETDYSRFLELVDDYLEELEDRIDPEVMLEAETDPEFSLWMALEARPYLLALHELYMIQVSVGDFDGAYETGLEMLDLMPGDNLGVRYSFYALAVLMKDQDSLENLEEDYGMDASAQFQYNRVLGAFAAGKKAKASRLLEKAIEANPHIPGQLLGTEEKPETPPGYFQEGSIEEAYIFSSMVGTIWASIPGAMEFLQREIATDKKKDQGNNILAFPTKK